MPSKFTSHLHRFPPFLLFTLALTVKLIFFFTHQSFSQDQVRDYLFIQNQITHRNFYIPLGPAAASYSNFSVLPGFYYLLLFAQLNIPNYFYAGDLLIILIESFSPVLLFFLLRQFIPNSKKSPPNHTFATTPAFLISLTYIFSPLLINFSTSAWNPNLIPFFTLLLLTTGLKFIIHKSNPNLPLAMLATIALTNLHFQWFVFLTFLLLIAFFTFYRFKQTWKFFLIGLVISLILISPYLHYEFTNQFANLSNALTFISNPNTPQFERIWFFEYISFFWGGFLTRLFTNSLFIPNWSFLYEFHRYTPPFIIGTLIFWLLIFTSILSLFKTSKSTLQSFLTTLHPSKLPTTIKTILPQLKLSSAQLYTIYTLLIFATMAISLRFYSGDKPDYFLLAFAPFFFIFLFLTGRFLAQKFPKITTFILILIIALEIFSLSQIPAVHSYSDFKQVVNEIKKLPADQRTIIPLNQELVVPLTLFFSPNELSQSPNPHFKYNILICSPWQQCQHYDPFLPTSEYHFYKYDLITPTNFHINYPSYNATASNTLVNNTLQAKFIVQD